MRTFLPLGVGLIAGGVIGAYAMTVVYGQHQRGPEPAKVICPPCPACVAPPPSPGVASAGGEDDTTPETGPSPGASATPAGPETLDLPTEGRVPGLPSSALKLASSGFTREIAPCLDQARTENMSGSLLVDLTVTSTDGIGRIRDLGVIKADATAAGLQPCLLEAARRVHFEWTNGDGESRLRYPIGLKSAP